MRYFRYLLLLLVAVGLISISLANRELVGFHFLPSIAADALGFQVHLELPLFIVIFLCVAVGLLVGSFWEWLRTTQQRLSLRSYRREVARLSKEIIDLKPSGNVVQDDVLELVEKVS